MNHKTAFMRVYTILFYNMEEDETTFEELVGGVKDYLQPRQIDYLYHIGFSRKRYPFLRVMIDNGMSAVGRSACLYRLFEGGRGPYPAEVLELASDMIRTGLYSDGEMALFRMSIWSRDWEVVRMILRHCGLPAIWREFHALPRHLRDSLAICGEEDIEQYAADLEKCRLICMVARQPLPAAGWEKMGVPDVWMRILPYMAPSISI